MWTRANVSPTLDDAIGKRSVRASPKRKGPIAAAIALLALAGPGIISASAGNDAGGIATYASAGSQFAYRTLFFMVIVTVAYVAVQEMTARLAVHTGKGLAALIREQFSIRWTALAMTCFAIANIGLAVTEFAGIAAAFGLFGVSRYIAVPIAAVVIWMLVVLGSYRYAERIFLLLSLVFVTYPLAMILGHPRWGTVASSLVLPHFESSKSFVLLGVALIGTTITPYIQLYEAGALVDRGVGPTDFRRARIDAISGAVVSDVVSICIIVATGAAIGGSGVLQSAAEAAKALRPVAGSAAEALFGIGLLGASALAAAVVPLSTAYALAEAVGVERSVSRNFRQAPFFLGVFTSQIAIGGLVVLVPGNLIQLIVNTQVLEGLITPITLAFIFILACRRRVLGAAANGRLGRTVGAISVGGVGAFSLVLVVLAVLGWFGIS
jgi:NRAMP (natural resistance-associated macrophage protein)-like metal ion transporter